MEEVSSTVDEESSTGDEVVVLGQGRVWCKPAPRHGPASREKAGALSGSKLRSLAVVSLGPTGALAACRRERPFRTLVVVPLSHRDGTFERLCGGNRRAGQVQCRDTVVASRAVQLDVRPRPGAAHRSLFLAWDPRTVHQGHTHGTGTGGWEPRLLRPPLFGPEEPAWREHLAVEGYVAVADPLSHEEVDEALHLLLADLRLLFPPLRSLGDVREGHLPRTSAANDLRTGAGLCHGQFAWFLRTRPAVGRLFERLFDLMPGAPLVGSMDVVALAPPGSSATHGRGKQWLHLDYSPPQGRVCQACLQVFPRNAESGGEWERIALMLCKAPVAWAQPAVERSLFACYVTGTASRATAGVTLGKVHAERAPAKCPGGRRLLPAVAGAPLVAAEVGAGAFASGAASALRVMAHRDVARRCSAAALRRLVPPQVAAYIWPQVPRGAQVVGSLADAPPRKRPRTACFTSSVVGERDE